jgi:beta-xylosidase
MLASHRDLPVKRLSLGPANGLPEEKGEEENITLQLQGLTGTHSATLDLVDADHGSLRKAYAAMGSPTDPTQAQIRLLKKAAELPPAVSLAIREGRIDLKLAPKALALIEIR